MAATPDDLTSNLPPYIGRFAPSPSGPLHFGSLVGALASYCDARANKGKWLVRMEDLDPPREQAGAADTILKTLETHGLLWDDDVLYQSQRTGAYEAALKKLQKQNLSYPCFCTRKALQKEGPIYPGYCLHHSPIQNQAFAIRLKTASDLELESYPNSGKIDFDDVFLGEQSVDISRDIGDFIIKRKDGLFAYQLAVVVDDAVQNISHVIRGSDLLDSTPAQIHLQRCLGFSTPHYGHFPVATNRQGQKLSKQHHATGIDGNKPNTNLFRALEFLLQQPPAELLQSPVQEIVDWACLHWDRQKIPAVIDMVVDDTNCLSTAEIEISPT